MSTLLLSWRRHLAEKLWLRPTLASLLSMSLAAFAYWFGQTFDQELNFHISEDSLVSLLSIVASSMLSVATFTLSGIIAAASSASNSTTPRASRLILADNTAQFVLSSFVATFIYGYVSIFSLKAMHYGSNGRFVLFLGLIAMMGLVLVAFLRWVNYAMSLGRQSSTIERLLNAAMASMRPATVGTFGAHAWDGTVPSMSTPIYPSQHGYVLRMDVAKLQALAERHALEIKVNTRPGETMDPYVPIVYLSPARQYEEAITQAVAACFIMGSSRQTEDDVRYAVLNLSETGDRALSAAINDPGTAIHILNVFQTLFGHWSQVRQDPATQEVLYPAVSVCPLTAEELVNDSFAPLARDGAAMLEVGVRLQKVLEALTRHNDPELSAAAKAMSRVALDLAQHALVADAQKQRLAEIARFSA